MVIIMMQALSVLLSLMMKTRAERMYEAIDHLIARKEKTTVSREIESTDTLLNHVKDFKEYMRRFTVQRRYRGSKRRYLKIKIPVPYFHSKTISRSS